MVGRGDAAWARIPALLRPTRGGGGRWHDRRQVNNLILWQDRTGAAWLTCANATARKTAHERLRDRTTVGTWDRILAEVIVKDDRVGAVEWTFSVDCSSMRAHQHAAGARKAGFLRRMDRGPHR